MKERPEVTLDFDGPGGNTMVIVGRCMRAARSAGWDKEVIEAWKEEALSNDRAHVLDMVFEYFDVKKFVPVAVSVDRDGIR